MERRWRLGELAAGERRREKDGWEKKCWEKGGGGRRWSPERDLSGGELHGLDGFHP